MASGRKGGARRGRTGPGAPVGAGGAAAGGAFVPWSWRAGDNAVGGPPPPRRQAAAPTRPGRSCPASLPGRRPGEPLRVPAQHGQRAAVPSTGALFPPRCLGNPGPCATPQPLRGRRRMACRAAGPRARGGGGGGGLFVQDTDGSAEVVSMRQACPPAGEATRYDGAQAADPIYGGMRIGPAPQPARPPVGNTGRRDSRIWRLKARLDDEKNALLI